MLLKLYCYYVANILYSDPQLFQAGVATTNEGATSDVTTMTEVTTLSASRAAMGGNNGLVAFFAFFVTQNH
jgi:hypothetical protein